MQQKWTYCRLCYKVGKTDCSTENLLSGGNSHERKNREKRPAFFRTGSVVEDNESVRRLTREVLLEQGYRVMDAADGHKALAILKRDDVPVQLLLTDVVMPGMDGKRLFAEAVKVCPTLKVLYMSGYPDNVIAQHGVLEAGIDLIQKPFSMQSLAAKIRSVLDG